MLIDALARTPGTLLNRKLAGDDWSLDQHLLAVVADRIAMGNWQRQARKGAKRPALISPLAKRRPSTTVGKVAGRTREQMADLLAAYRTGAFDRG